MSLASTIVMFAPPTQSEQLAMNFEKLFAVNTIYYFESTLCALVH